MRRSTLALALALALVLGLALEAQAQQPASTPFRGEQVIIPSAPRSTVTPINSAWFRMEEYRGVLIACNALSITLTPVINPTIEFWYSANAQSQTLYTFAAAAALDAVETVKFGVLPLTSGATAAQAQVADMVTSTIPPGMVWRLVMTGTDTDTINYSCMAWPQ